MPRICRDLNWTKNAFGRDWRPICSTQSDSIFSVFGPKDGGSWLKPGLELRISFVSEKHLWKASGSMYTSALVPKWTVVVFVWHGKEPASILDIALALSMTFDALHGISRGISTSPALMRINSTTSTLFETLQQKMPSSNIGNHRSLCLLTMIGINRDTTMSTNPRSCPLIQWIWFGDKIWGIWMKESSYLEFT